MRASARTAGRIDKQILLDYLRPQAATEMITHYFSVSVSAEQTNRLAFVLGRVRLTPAMMEQLCAEHDTVDAMIDALSRM